MGLAAGFADRNRRIKWLAAKPVALVTGGANGIGRAIAHHLLDTGWRLGIVDLPGSGLRRAFPARSRNVLAIEGDVRR